MVLIIAVSLAFSFSVFSQTCTNAPSGLVAWYRGEGDANDSAGTANGIFFNPTYAPGEVGQAFSFNGTSSFIEVPSAAALDFTNSNPMTVEMWVERTGSATTMQLLGKRGSACGAIQYQVSLTPGAGLAFDIGSGSITTGYQLPLNIWVHLAVTFDGTNVLMYINGILSGSGTGTLGSDNDAPVYIGTSSSCPGFEGLLDEVSFYNRALSSSEIQSIYNAGNAGKCLLPPVIIVQPQSQTVPAGTNVTFSVTALGGSSLGYQWMFNGTNLSGATDSSILLTNIQPPNAGNYSVLVSNAAGYIFSANALLSLDTCYPAPQGLVSWWPGEGNANDKIGTNNGTLVGGVTFVPGQVGQAFDLNGANQYVDVPTSSSLNPTTNLTLEAWIFPRLPLDPISSPIIKKAGQGTAQSYGYTLEFYGTNQVRMIVYVNSNGSPSPAMPVNFNQWNHVAGVFDGTKVSIYVNGILGGSTTAVGQLITSGNDLQLGHDPSNPSRYYNGLIDEASLYNVALSATQIQAIYNAGAQGKCLPLPYFLVQPVSQTAFVGASAAFTASASGASGLSYQWQFNGTVISGATQTALALTNLVLTNAGVYSVTVSNAAGSVTSSNAILTLLSPTCTITPSNLLGGWSGEDNFNDNSGLNNGQPAGNVTFSQGLVGLAFNLNGTNAYVDVPNSATLNPATALTIEAWIYPRLPLNATAAPIVKKAGQGTAQQDGYSLEFSATNGVRLIVYLNTVGSVVSPIVPVAFNQWSHVAGVFDGTNVYVYVNGVLGGTAAAAGQIVASGNDLQLGHDPSNASRYYNGLIDEASVYGSALSAAQIQALYDAYSAGKCPVPAAFVVQPRSTIVFPGTNVTLTASASGSNPLGYQWYYNGAALAGATNPSLTLTNVQPSNSGVFTVTASNALATVTSSNAVLSVQVVTILGNGQVLANMPYTFGNSVTILMQNLYTNGDIFYTLDGSTPNFSSTPYTGPFTLTQNAVIKALGYDVNFANSAVSGPVGINIEPAYTLSATTPGGGSVTVSPTNSPYLSNSVVSLVATPSNGWSFLSWAGAVSGTGLTNSVLMNSNKSVQALFGTTLTATSSTGGTVLRSPAASLYPFGMSVELSALPQSNNYFAIWGNAASGNVNPLYFPVTNANSTVSALFVPLASNQVSLAVVALGEGKVSIAPPGNVFTNGQSVTITATPNASQSFLGWSGSASSTQNPLTVVLGTNETIYANFSRTYSFSFSPLTSLGLGGGFQLDLTGEIPVAYRFDASTDLSNWLPLVTLTNYTGTLQYTDTNAIQFDRRFYRSVPLQ